MASHVAWLDTSEDEQRTAREIVELFSQKDSVDELGLGQIRDVLSNELFAGTSVLQTRARYYLFIPWCYEAASRKGKTGKALVAQGEANERRLISAMKNAGLEDSAGLIGSRVGAAIKTLPSTMYWNGMITYDIRQDAPIGSLGSVHEDEQSTEHLDGLPPEWDAWATQHMPDGFPDEVPGGFALTRDEAEWLRDRMLKANGNRVMGKLLTRSEEIPPCAFPWSPEVDLEWSDDDDLGRAYWFSNFMHGSALLYNVLIGQRWNDVKREESDDTDLAARFRMMLDEWEEEFLRTEETLTYSGVDDLLRFVTSKNPNITLRTQTFVREWVEGAQAAARSGRSVMDDADLRQLVRVREQRKGRQSRFNNDKMLDGWEGSGFGQLAYRWGTVRTLVNDIVRGLQNVDA